MANNRNVLTWLTTILDLVKTKLGTTDAVVDSSKVIISLQDEYNAPSGNIMVLLVPGPQRPDQGLVTGAGNNAVLMLGEIGVVIWTRFNVDSATRGHEKLISDTSRGSLEVMRKVMKSLQMYDPTNDDTDFYLAEPMRLSDGGWMTKQQRQRGEWAPLSCSFEFSYLADLTS